MYSLGIEFSTQSVKTVALNLKEAGVAYKGAFDYDNSFPLYETVGGVLHSGDPNIRHTSPLMLLEALDHVFSSLSVQGVDPSLIRVIKVDAMQHCTVYTNKSFKAKIENLNPTHTLAGQLGTCLTRRTSPIWEDRSPDREAEYLTGRLEACGGITNLTGNRAELRFPAAQILKWAVESPREYEATTNIFLLSAFMTSVLCAKISPVDTGDGWGTNLNNLDINHPGWSREAISAADEYLSAGGIRDSLSGKIGAIDHYDSYAGTINSYFVQKYKLRPETAVLTGTGDNPASLLGCGGNLMISLGSSYTVCGVMEEIRPSSEGEYNIFGYIPGKAMALSVITNGGKVHNEFRRRYLGPPGNYEQGKRDWEAYVRLAGDVRLSKDEKLMLPYLLDESVPLRARGVVRNGFTGDEAAANIRALQLSQVLSLKCHAGHLGEVEELCLVAGGAENRLFRQWIADAFKARTYTIRNAGVAAPLGCALSGTAGVLGLSYREAAGHFIRRDEDSICEPLPDNIKIMEQLGRKYRDLENCHKR